MNLLDTLKFIDLFIFILVHVIAPNMNNIFIK